MNRQIIEKFINNTCTPREEASVREWLQTAEGQEKLKEIMDEDIDFIRRKNLKPTDSDLDSEKILQSIMGKTAGMDSPHYKKNRNSASMYFRAAAVILVLMVPAILYFFISPQPGRQEVELPPELHFQTETENHKELTLTDGSKVRLNKDSELWISESFLENQREVTLNGEAYFEVTPNPDRPFVVHTKNTTVRVLGTSFNVKARESEENIQVAVLEGRVSVKSFVGESKEQTQTLEKNQFGFVDLPNKQLRVENVRVDNYLNWMSGKLAFDALPFQEVCTQLKHIYSMKCVFASESIKERTLTANFQSESAEQVFEVISLAMSMEYQVEGNQITWLPQKSNE